MTKEVSALRRRSGIEPGARVEFNQFAAFLAERDGRDLPEPGTEAEVVEVSPVEIDGEAWIEIGVVADDGNAYSTDEAEVAVIEAALTVADVLAGAEDSEGTDEGVIA